MNVTTKIKNKINKCYTKYLLNHNQDQFQFDDACIKYLLVPAKHSDILVVVFSGMNPYCASYNYIDLLNDMKCHRLYILDDVGDDILGCYYLGTNGSNHVEVAIKELIKTIKSQLSVNKCVFCGSSKGGYAALNIGLDFPKSTIIAGAPQYKLGYYLVHRKSPKLLNIIVGESFCEENIQNLDMILRNKIIKNSSRYNGMIYLHFSDQEHTYNEHIENLLSDLLQYGYYFEENRASYSNHDDVAIYFPPYLKNILGKLLG